MPFKQTKEEPQTARCNLRLTPSEHLELSEAAKIAGLSLSEYVRRRALGRVVIADTDLVMLRELRRVGGLLKHIHNESNGAYSQLTADALETIRETIGRIANGRQKS